MRTSVRSRDRVARYFPAARNTSSRRAGGIRHTALLHMARPQALRMRWCWNSKTVLPRDTPQRHDIACLDAEDMCGPSIKCLCALAGEVMSLINSGDTEKLRRLMGKDLVHYDRVEAEPSQHQDTRAAQIVDAPLRQRFRP